MRMFIAVSFAAAAVLVCAPLWAQTQVTGQGGQTITESTEPPPRTIIPEKKAPSAQPRPYQERSYSGPSYQPQYQPMPYGHGYHGAGSTKCDLPGGCDTAVPEGAVTLEQLDARRSGAAAPAPVPAQRYTPPPPAPMPPPQYSTPAPAPAPAQRYVAPAPQKTPAPAYEEPIYESSKDKPVVLRHYIPGVSDTMPVYPGAAPSPAQRYAPPPPAPAPMPSPAPKYAAPAPAPAPMPAPAPSYGPVKSDLPGYSPEPLPPGTIRLEDVKSPQSGYVPPPKGAGPAPAPAYDTAPARQMDQYEEIPARAAPDSDLEVQRPASRWKQGK
ncbi:MAG: hypothetical protein JXA24_07980 [Proteobacteria bacterium]|nr:hypothetical protein [Pseudomonadota bacterium]